MALTVNKNGIKILNGGVSRKTAETPKSLKGAKLTAPLGEKLKAALRAAKKAANEAAKAAKAEKAEAAKNKRKEELVASIKNARELMGLIFPWVVAYPTDADEVGLVDAYSELAEVAVENGVKVATPTVKEKAISPTPRVRGTRSRRGRRRPTTVKTSNPKAISPVEEIKAQVLKDIDNAIRDIKLGLYGYVGNEDYVSPFAELGAELKALKINGGYMKFSTRHAEAGEFEINNLPVPTVTDEYGTSVDNTRMEEIVSILEEATGLRISYDHSYWDNDFKTDGYIVIKYHSPEAIDMVFKHVNNLTEDDFNSKVIYNILKNIFGDDANYINSPKVFWEYIRNRKIIREICDGFESEDFSRWFFGASGYRRPEVDPEAFYIFEEMLLEKVGDGIVHKYLDSCGVYGFSIWDIKRLWFKTGVGKNIRLYRYLIKQGFKAVDDHGRLDGFGGSRWYQNLLEYVGKYSLTDIKYLLKGKRRFNQFKKMHTVIDEEYDDEYSIIDATLSNRAFIRIGKLGYRTAFVVMHATFIDKDGTAKDLGNYNTENDRYRKSGINHWTNGEVSIVGHTRLDFSLANLPKYKKLSYCPINYQWWEVFGMKAPQLLESFSPLSLGFKSINALKRVRDKFNVEDDNGYRFAVEVIKYSIFQNPQAISQFEKKLAAEGWDEYAINSTYANNSTLVINPVDAKILATTLNRFPVLFEESFNKIINVVKKEYNGIAPRSLGELKAYLAAYKYDKIKYPEVAKEAGARNLSENKFHKYEKLWSLALETKTYETIPGFEILDNEYVYRKVDALDPTGMFVGLDTDCCQHLDSAGADCCKHGACNPNSSFYAIYKAGNVVVQSWVWRDGNTIVLDSIEAKSGVTLDRIIKLLKLLPEAVLGKLGVTEIRVGKTSYGITNRVREELNLPKCNSHVSLKGYNGYIDGKKQVCFAKLENGTIKTAW